MKFHKGEKIYTRFHNKVACLCSKMPIFKKKEKIIKRPDCCIFLYLICFDQLLFVIFFLRSFSVDVNSNMFATSICSISSKVGQIGNTRMNPNFLPATFIDKFLLCRLPIIPHRFFDGETYYASRFDHI